MATGPRRAPDSAFKPRIKKLMALAFVAAGAGYLSFSFFETRVPQAQPLPALEVAIIPGESPWIALGETPAMTLYWDRSSRVRDDQVLKVWEIQDMKAPDPDGVQSRRYRNEYDCKHRMYRLSAMTSYAGPMLTGAKLFELDDEGVWRQMPPNSVFAQGLALHCGKLPPLPAEEEKAPWWAPFWPF